MSFLWLFVLVALAGCSQSDSQDLTDKPLIATKDRPPLQVWLIDAPELEKEISNRWQSASDQPVLVQSTDALTLEEKMPSNVDVVIFPGHMMGSLIARGVVGKLPAQYIQTLESKSDEKISNWPVRWRNIATYGGQLYGIPLGAPSLGAIVSNVDPAAFVEIEKSLASSKLSTENSMVLWNQFLKMFERSVPRDLTSNEQLDRRIGSLSDLEAKRLVDSFLWIASTTDARRKGLFDLLKMQSRIHQTEFVVSSQILARIVRAVPNGVLADSTKAWMEPFNSNGQGPIMAIGYPSNTEQSTSKSKMDSPPSVLPWLWNNESGLVAAIAKNTRQTAVSSAFLDWLSSPDQRDALRLLTSRIELLPSQSDRGAHRADSREYQSLLSRPAFHQGMDLSLRFDHGADYRKRLAESLVQIVRNPENAESVLAECSTAWNELTNRFGMEKQRISIEQSLGLNK